MTTDYTPKIKPQFLKSDIIYAFVTLVAGYLFTRLFLFQASYLGALLWLFFIYGVTYAFLRKRGYRVCTLSYMVGISGLLVSLALILSANKTLAGIASLYALLAYSLSIACMTDTEKRISYSDHMLADTIRSAIVMPFSSLGAVFSAVVSTKGIKGGGKFLGKIVLGISLAFIPTIIIGVLLSYDDGFRAIIGDIFSFDIDKIFAEIGYLIFTAPVSCLLYGLYHSARTDTAKTSLSQEKCAHVGGLMRKLSPITALAFSLPFFFLYIVFVLSQWEYYVSAFSGVLPEGVSNYADYARNGFFQLCTVSALNALLLLFTGLFTKRRAGDDRAHPLIRVIHMLFSICSLILIATALSKLFLYIDRFGMSQKRIYAGFFMFLLTALFLLVIVKQLFKRLQMLAIWCTVCIVLFGVLGMINMDGYIADYNVERYLSDESGTVFIDTEQLSELGDAAVPAIVRLAKEASDEEIYTWAHIYVADYYKLQIDRFEPYIWQWNLPYHQAIKTAEAYLKEEGALS